MSDTSVLDDALGYLAQDRAIVAVVPWLGSLVTVASMIRVDQLPQEQAAIATGADDKQRAAFLINRIECLRRMLDDTLDTA